MEQDRSFAEQFSAINLDFSNQLPEHGHAIARLWGQAKQGAPDGPSFQQLYRLIHNLAGSGGAFGYPRVTESAHIALASMGQAAEESNRQLTPAEIEQQGLNILELVAICEGRGYLHDRGPSESTEKAVTSRGLVERDSQLIFLVAAPGEERDRLAKRIGRYGYQATCFSSLDESRQAQAHHLPVAVVLDTTAKKSIPGGEQGRFDLQSSDQAPVVLISNEVDFASRLASVRNGTSGFFAKPVDVGNLLNFIESLTPQEPGDPFRVLIVDDDLKQAQYHALLLQQAGMLTRVLTNPAEIIDQLIDFDPELLLFDVYMPDCSGAELAEIVRQMDAYRRLPIVFLSIKPEFDHKLEGMKSGADVFLIKPVLPQQLISSVSVRAGRSRNLRLLMIKDSLTGLYHHGVIMERLQYMLALTQRQQGHLCVALLNLEHLKQVNDEYGHSAGDQVLVAFSRLLRQRLRNSDIVGRYGGEEFLVIFPDTPLDQAKCVLDEIRVIFTGITFPSKDRAVEFTVTFSGGLAASPDYADSKSLLEATDKMLHRAKALGRDRIEVAVANPGVAGG